MTIRIYVLPMEAETSDFIESRGPKYLTWSRELDPSDNVGETAWSVINYGLYDWGIVAVEATGPVHTALAAKPDVQQVPANLAGTCGVAGRDAARAFLENAALPGQWIQSETTWREVVRTVCGFMLFAQRYDGIRQVADSGAPSLGSQIVGNLGVQWGNIPVATRTAVIAAGGSFGYDLSFIADSTLVRAILKQLADLWGEQPVFFGLEEFNGGETFTV